MRAIVHHRYGGPEVLELVERPMPEPGPRDLVVRVQASSVNAADWRLMRADPFLARLQSGLIRPRKWTGMGSDFAGVVEAVGAEVTGFAAGDAVFGDAFPDGRGAWADHVRVAASSVVQMPPQVSFAEAAAAPLAGVTALQALRDLGRVKSGDRVLVQGAGGGVGGFVVQLAVAFGARVTAVCSTRSADLVRAFGAEAVLDHALEDFATQDDRYDVIVAVNGRRSLWDYRGALADGGRLVVVGGTTRQILEGLLLGPLVFLGSGKRVATLTVDDRRQAQDLAVLRDLLAEGRLRVVLDRTFALEHAADAVRYVEAGHVRGKVVLVTDVVGSPTEQ